MVDIALLKKEIDDLKIPITTLAEKCGVSRPTFYAWLERPELMSVDHAKKLADALRITDRDKLLAIFFV